MEGLNPVFHLSVICEYKQDVIVGRQHPETNQVKINEKEKWEIKDILDCQRQHKNLQYVSIGEGFGTKHNSWEPRNNLYFFWELIIESNSRFTDSVSQH